MKTAAILIAISSLLSVTSHATGTGVCGAQASAAAQGLAKADASIPTTLIGTGSLNERSAIDGSIQTIEIYSFSSELRGVDISLIVGSPCRLNRIDVKQYD